MTRRRRSAAKSSGGTARRGRPFPKGTSGNPKGRPPGRQNRATVQAKEAALALVGDPAYLKSLRERLFAGELAGTVEALLWHYAFGKPHERVELTGTVDTTSILDALPPEKRVHLLRRALEATEREAGGATGGPRTTE